MTTINMQPGEHDLVTDILGGIVAGLTFGLIDLTAGDQDLEAGGAGGGPIGRIGPCLEVRSEDREAEA